MTKNEKRDKQNKIPLNFIAAIDEILGKKSLKSLLRNCFKSKNKSEDEDEITWNEFTFWINTLGNHWYFFFSFILFFVFGPFWQRSYANTKILRLLARQDGQDRKNRKENLATEVTKIPKTKRQKYGMNKTFVSKIVLTYCEKKLF